MCPCTSRATAGSINMIVNVVVATVNPRRAHTTIVLTATIVAQPHVAVAAVAVVLLFDGVKPVPHVTPSAIPAGNRII